MSDSKVVDLLGYKYAKRGNSSHSYDALVYSLPTKQPQKKVTKIEWTSVSDRLPSGNSNLS